MRTQRIIPRVNMSSDGTHYCELEETDPDVILLGIKTIFPLFDNPDERQRRQDMINAGFADFTHFWISNWHNILTRGDFKRHWKALEYLNEWAYNFFKCEVIKDSIPLSFMRKQQRLVKALIEEEKVQIMCFAAPGGTQTMIPRDTVWGFWNENCASPEEKDAVYRIIERKWSSSESDDTSSSKRSRDGEVKPHAKLG